MNLVSFFEETAAKDPTWVQAYTIVKRGMPVPTHVTNLFKTGWNGQITLKDYLKVLGFSDLNPACLLNAAGMASSSVERDAEYVERSINFLGIRLTAVVLAINFVSRTILKRPPPPDWKKLFEEMMAHIEVGYKLGSKLPEIGSEGGALVGFARFGATGLLMSSQPDRWGKYRRFVNEPREAKERAEVELFGCSVYQIAALMLQRLGFGAEIALGTALGIGDVTPNFIALNREVLRWKVACLWVECLRRGRNYPSEVETRNFFSELTPGTTTERNLTLEVLYTEIAKIKTNGSVLTWHLPRSTYEATEALWTPK